MGQASSSGNLRGTGERIFVNRQPCYVDLINMCSANSKQIPALPRAEFLRSLPSKTLCHSCGEASQTGQKLGSRQGRSAVEAEEVIEALLHGLVEFVIKKDFTSDLQPIPWVRLVLSSLMQTSEETRPS